jgi:predicted HicB family RNase H-like nuclease
MKQERLDMVVPAWLKQALRDAAKNKGVSMSEYVKDILKEAIKNEEKKE